MESNNEIGTEGDRTDAEARSALQVAGAERTNELAQAYEELKRAQAELQRRWQYLAEAQRLSHSGTFGWKVSSGELVWSDETYRILDSHEKRILRSISYSTEFTPTTGRGCSSSEIVPRRTAWI